MVFRESYESLRATLDESKFHQSYRRLMQEMKQKLHAVAYLSKFTDTVKQNC